MSSTGGEEGRRHGPGRRPERSGRARFAPKVIERSPGLEEDPRGWEAVRPHPQSTLKRIEDEEREQARRSERIRVRIRLTAMGAVILALFSIMVFRLWSLQVLHSTSARSSVIADVTADVTITPPRGLIEARGGQVLVSDKVEPVVTLSRQVAADDPTVVRRLAVFLGLSVRSIDATLNDQQDSIYEPAPIAVGVPTNDIVYLAEHKALFPGVSVSDVAERQYPFGETAAQTLGYVSDIPSYALKAYERQGYSAGDLVGLTGIEQQYEKYLRGQTGVKQLLLDPAGDPVGVKHVTAAKPGDTVVLNLDLGLEQTAAKDLAAQIDALQASNPLVSSGAVVVENPQNGQILAMVSLPSYDPSWWVGGLSEAHWNYLRSASANTPLFNRAIDGTYTPGSTFKIATATAALDDGLITPGTYINDPGSFTLPNCTGLCTFLDAESGGCYCNVTKALAISDDVFFYTLGYWFYTQPGRYGTEPIQKAAGAYGFGKTPAIDLPDAAAGDVDSPAWRRYLHSNYPKDYPYTYYGPGDALETAFGQGETLVTPLQLADAYSTFANGGTDYAPEVASEIVNPEGKLVRRISPKVEGHARLSSADREAMLQGFEAEVTSPQGTGYSALQLTHYPYPELPIAGKTGTSQVSATNANQTDSLYVAFGPVSHPKYCIAVIIPNGGYGAQASAPVAFRLFEYLIHNPVASVRPASAVAR